MVASSIGMNDMMRIRVQTDDVDKDKDKEQEIRPRSSSAQYLDRAPISNRCKNIIVVSVSLGGVACLLFGFRLGEPYLFILGLYMFLTGGYSVIVDGITV